MQDVKHDASESYGAAAAARDAGRRSRIGEAIAHAVARRAGSLASTRTLNASYSNVDTLHSVFVQLGWPVPNPPEGICTRRPFHAWMVRCGFEVVTPELYAPVSPRIPQAYPKDARGGLHAGDIVTRGDEVGVVAAIASIAPHRMWVMQGEVEEVSSAHSMWRSTTVYRVRDKDRAKALCMACADEQGMSLRSGRHAGVKRCCDTCGRWDTTHSVGDFTWRARS